MVTNHKKNERKTKEKLWKNKKKNLKNKEIFQNLLRNA